MSFNSILGDMTGGLTPSVPNYSGASSLINKKNQAQIDQGLQAINATYFGGSYPIYSAVAKNAAYNPNLTYAKPNNKTGGYTAWSPQFKAGKANAVTGPTLGLSKSGAAGNVKNFKPGGKNLFEVTQSPYQTGFTPAFYQGVANDYAQAAIPQLAQQQKQAQNAISYGLFNKGLTPGSSAYADAMSQLNQTTGTAEQQIANNAVSAANNTQQQVMNSYQNAINQLYQTGNPAQAAQGAVAGASQLNVPQTFAPIANAFSSLANNYATNLLYNYNPSGGVSYAPTGGSSNTGFLGATANYGE